MFDPFDSLLDTLDSLDGRRTKLWHECRDAKGAVVGVHPIAVNAKDDAATAAWEERCKELHRNQTTVLPSAKPAPQSVIGGIRRTVTVVDSEPSVPKFEDSEESRNMRKRALERGD